MSEPEVITTAPAAEPQAAPEAPVSTPEAPIAAPEQPLEPSSPDSQGNPSLIPEVPESDPSQAPETPDGEPSEKTFAEDWQLGKFESPEKLSEAYQELQSKFGGFNGAPKDGVYDFTFDESMGEVELDTESEMYTSFMKMATGSNMNQETANELMQMHIAEVKKIESELGGRMPDKAEEVSSIPNYEERGGELAKWMNTNFSKDQFGVLESLVTTKEEFEVFETIMDLANKSVKVTGHDRPVRVSTETEADLKALMADPDLPNSTIKQKQLAEAYARVYGTSAVEARI